MTDPTTNNKHKPQKPQQRSYGGWWFLAVGLIIYIITALFDRNLVLTSIDFFSGLLGKVVPVLLLVFGLIFLFNYFFNPQIINRYLGAKSGFAGWLLAIIGGILSTGPVTAWYVMLRDLRQQGMTSSLAAVFLYSRAVKLPLLPLLIYYFGFHYTVVLCVYLIGFSMINGFIIGRVHPDQIEN
ncbi:MAG: hypothetical protein AMJ53_18530 [Gammaproteobacteria bacterium SG8_11]|nr:MAG: hypothetical protein AMJ53_18530 [Gammaproteobacteria bacterium SG8_11]